ncbi:YjeF N-terminal domain-like protein [Thozetella sp. PMI_491]|nr:YjeF N-terminal domain-like protein [Thozetella sp. PMI_491]
MADQFIGLQMLVTVRDPPARLKGTVSSVEAGSGLTLSNVWLLDSGRWEPRLTIPSSNIVDLQELSSALPQANSIVAPNAPAAATPSPQPAAPAQPGFQDPAIVAMGARPSSLPKQGLDSQNQPNTSEKRDPQPAKTASIPPQVAPTATPPAVITTAMTTTTIVTESLKQLKVEEQAVALDSAEEERAIFAPFTDMQAGGQKKKRRQRKPRNGQQDDPEASPLPQVKTAGKGKGWRETPILESTSSFQPFNSLKKSTGKRRQQNDNGWASEDVTDVQEMGDFDFETELAKFDKQNLFEQMRKDDAIDEADRLVSHNRLPRPKPGTSGGKNLHYSENVLDITPTTSKPPKEKTMKETSNDFWNSEADDGVLNGGERLSGRELGSRQGSRRGESKVSTNRRSQSRKASAATTVGQAPNRINSGVSVHSRVLSLGGARSFGRLSAHSIDQKSQLPTSANTQGFYLLPSYRRLEPVSALQMLNLENIAHNELGLTEDMMTENAGRGIAEVTLTCLTDPALRMRHLGIADPAGTLPPPVVVVLAGNNKSGIRAVAAARHLRNKGFNVLVCVVGLERGELQLLEDMRRQVRLYKNFGGRVFSKIELFDHLRKISIPTLTIDTPRTSLTTLRSVSSVTLIIDALLGLAISFEELRTGDQATVYELIEWANRNEAFVLAVDVPTGIDPSSGKVSIIDGSRLYVKPRYVVAMGAPKRGLLEAMAAGDNEDDVQTVLAGETSALPDDTPAEWKLFVADVGLGASVWKKAGTKLRRGIDFDDKWVLEMKYQRAATDEDEPV